MTARDAMDISAVETAGDTRGIASLGLCRLGENVR